MARMLATAIRSRSSACACSPARHRPDIGNGCGGRLGTPTMHADTPHLGNAAFELRARNLPPGAPTLVAISTSRQTLALGGIAITDARQLTIGY